MPGERVCAYHRRVSHTLEVPDALDDHELAAYHVAEGAMVRAGTVVASFVLDGVTRTLTSDRDGVLWRWLLDPGSRCGSGAPVAILATDGENLGYDPAVARAVRISVLRRCDECGNDYPVNGLFDRVRCTRCGDWQRCSPAFWKEYVLGEVRQALTPRAAAGSEVLGGNHGAATVRCWGIPPLCRKCKTLLGWAAVVSAWDRSANGDPETEVFCGQCGELHIARTPPAWALQLLPGLGIALGEVVASPEASAKPVIFKCPSCLANLEIAGEKRIVRCKFCESDVYLPDDLWLHFNPAHKRGRWWLLLRP